MMKTCSRDLLQQMTETYKTRIAGTDDFRSTLDALFFTALRAARESDTLRQFDCFKEAERYLLRIAASSYLSGLMAGMAVGGKNCDAEKSSDAPARREKERTAFGLSTVRVEVCFTESLPHGGEVYFFDKCCFGFVLTERADG